MNALRIALLTFAAMLCLIAGALAGPHDGAACPKQHECGRARHWRSYTKEERRNFPRCYGGYERYYGGFHAQYFRSYPGADSGLQNSRYGWGNGWAW